MSWILDLVIHELLILPMIDEFSALLNIDRSIEATVTVNMHIHVIKKKN